MRDDPENIYMLLFRFVGKGFQLALCNVSWLATQESVVLVHDPIVFAPWSVFLDRGEHCDSCQGISDEAVFLRIGESDVYRQPIAVMGSLAVCYPLGQWTPPLVVVLCSLLWQIYWTRSEESHSSPEPLAQTGRPAELQAFVRRSRAFDDVDLSVCPQRS